MIRHIRLEHSLQASQQLVGVLLVNVPLENGGSNVGHHEWIIDFQVLQICDQVPQNKLVETVSVKWPLRTCINVGDGRFKYP